MAIPFMQPIPPKHRAPCAFCGEELDRTDPGVYQHTSGWVMNRRGGGGHAVSLPERDHQWAHRACVEKQVKGVTAQSALF